MKIKPKKILLFLFIWLCIGFALGTLTLLFPVRWWVTYARQHQFSGGQENLGVLISMALLIVLSFLLSRCIYHWQLNAQSKRYTLLSVFIPFLFALGALMVLMQPQWVTDNDDNSKLSEQFTVGVYPTEEKIKALKEGGYTAIITLLHPAVVPFEPVLLSEEEKLARKYDIQLIKAPMLPWVSDNTTSLQTIERLAKNKNARYYVHCYLGKDRVNLVKNLLIRLSGEEAIKIDSLSANRTFEQMKQFERGDLFRLAPGVYFTPYPTKEEFLAFFLAGEVKTVINLMDATNPDHQRRIQEEEEILKSSDIRFKNYTLNIAHPNLKATLKHILDSIAHLPKPIVVHHWNTTCPEARLFMKEFAAQQQEKPIKLYQANAPIH